MKLRKRGFVLMAALPAVAAASQAFAQEETSVESVDQRLRVLERKLELEKEEADAKAKAAAVVTAGPSGFSLAAGDKSYALQLKFLGQADGRQFFNDDKSRTGGNGGDTFTLRRVRPILSGTLGKFFEFNFTPEFGTGNTGVVDLWGAIKFSPAVNLKVGKYSLPVVLEPGANRHFNESPFTNSLAPNRDLGIELNGSPSPYLDYRVGVFNGSRNDVNVNDVLSDGDAKKAYAGRLTFKPLAGSEGALKSLALSVGGSVSDESGAATVGNINSVSRRSYFGYGSNVIDGRRTRVSPALTLYSGPFSGVAEYIREKAEYLRTDLGEHFDAKNTAWRTTLGYVLTGEDSSGNVNPKKPFAVGGPGWGAFELAVFASGIDFGDELFSTYTGGVNGGINPAASARDATAFGLAANWYLNRNVSLRFDYEQTAFDGAYQRTAHGVSRPADDEQAVSARLQINF